MDNTFRVGDIFPENDANEALMQLWVACRHELALRRALLAGNTPAKVKHEQFLHIFLAITATLKEAADAFRKADSLGCFNPVKVVLAAKLETARKLCSVKGNSLYNLVLVRLRHTVGAHFAPKLIRRSLRSLSSNNLVLRTGGKTFFDSTFPLATKIIEYILESHGITVKKAKRVFHRIVDLGGVLHKLTDATIAIAVRNSIHREAAK